MEEQITQTPEKKEEQITQIPEKKRGKRIFFILAFILIILAFFIFSSRVSDEAIEKIGNSMPLPLFTLIIGLIDGFNPCSIMVLTILLGLMISVSHSRGRIYLVGYTFLFVTFIIYFLFMAAWLNIFRFIGFTSTLRYAIAALALIAGLINMKEMFFFRKGVTLMIQEQHKKPLLARVERFREMIVSGSIPLLMISAIALALFTSLIEIPCTAGFPIIYTSLLISKSMLFNLQYYLYILLYCVFYVIPLVVITGIFGYTFKGKTIKKETMQFIKFIGGALMFLLGLILLFRPALIAGI